MQNTPSPARRLQAIATRSPSGLQREQAQAARARGRRRRSRGRTRRRPRSRRRRSRFAPSSPPPPGSRNCSTAAASSARSTIASRAPSSSSSRLRLRSSSRLCFPLTAGAPSPRLGAPQHGPPMAIHRHLVRVSVLDLLPQSLPHRPLVGERIEAGERGPPLAEQLAARGRRSQSRPRLCAPDGVPRKQYRCSQVATDASGSRCHRRGLWTGRQAAQRSPSRTTIRPTRRPPISSAAGSTYSGSKNGFGSTASAANALHGSMTSSES